MRHLLTVLVLGVLGAASGCELVSGVNDLRVEGRADDGADDELDDSAADDDRPDASQPSDDGALGAGDGGDDPSADPDDPSGGGDEDADDGAPANDEPGDDEPGDDEPGDDEPTTDEGDASVDDVPGTDDPADDCQPTDDALCDPIAGCGCDADRVCSLDRATRQASCRVPGTRVAGERCDADVDCVAGASCVSERCLAACDDDEDCAPAGATCVRELAGNTSNAGLGYCVNPCDPHDADACEETERCHSLAPGVAGCAEAGEGAIDAPCGASGDCGAGLECATQSGQATGTCAPRCELGGDAQCDGLGACRAIGAAGIDARIGACSCEPPAGWQCELTTQCGCDQGEACIWSSVGDRAVCSVAGSTPAQQLCDQSSDCAQGLACGLNACAKYCSESADCEADGFCAPLQLEGEVLVAGYCTSACDPISPHEPDVGLTACAAGGTCAGLVGLAWGDGDLTTCVGFVGELAQGAACSIEYGFGECAPGFTCAGDATGSSLECRRWCDDDSPCDDGGECQPLTRFNGKDVGVCSTPVCGNGVVEASELCDDGNLDEDDGCTTACAPCQAHNPASTCSVVPNCGCDEGEMCQVTAASTGAATCLAEGSAEYGDACSVNADCVAGLMCVSYGVDNGRCGATCLDGDEASCRVAEQCVPFFNGSVPIPDLYGCVERCDPVNLTRTDDLFRPCRAGEQCIAVYADVARCEVSTGDAAVGEACVDVTDCEPGAACILGVCRAACRVEADCPLPADRCSMVFDVNAAEDDPIGVCSTPCDPVGGASGCDDEQSCAPTPDLPMCLGALQSLPEGATCSGLRQCEDGLTCVDNVCARVCRENADCDLAAPACLFQASLFDVDGGPLGYCTSGN